MVTTGTAISDERYAPWGTARDASQQAAVPYRYTGQREEAALGLYDYGARWYDPAVGRFIQADTIVPQPGNPQSLNRYSYTLNNPMRYTDPTGHTVEDDTDGGVPAEIYRLWRDYQIIIKGWLKHTETGWNNTNGWGIRDVETIIAASGDIAAAIGGIEQFQQGFGEITVIKGGPENWAAIGKIGLGSAFLGQPFPKGLFVHEAFHIENEHSGYVNTLHFLDATHGESTPDHYYPGGFGAVTISPYNLLEDYADGAMGYIYPEYANRELRKSQGIIGFTLDMMNTYIGSTRWQYFHNRWQ
jgi:RHS repeat-associated protein